MGKNKIFNNKLLKNSNNSENLKDDLVENTEIIEEKVIEKKDTNENEVNNTSSENVALEKDLIDQKENEENIDKEAIKEDENNQKENIDIDSEKQIIEKKIKTKYTFKTFLKRFWYWFVVIPILIVGIILWAYYSGYISKPSSNIDPEKEIVNEITASPEAINLYLGQIYNISLNKGYENAKFTLEKGGIFTISDNGIINPIKAGSDIIHITIDNKRKDCLVEINAEYTILYLKAGTEIPLSYVLKGTDENLSPIISTGTPDAELENQSEIIIEQDMEKQVIRLNKPGKADISVYQNQSEFRYIFIECYDANDDYWKTHKESEIDASYLTSDLKDIIADKFKAVETTKTTMHTGIAEFMDDLYDTNDFINYPGFIGVFCLQGDEYIDNSNLRFNAKDFGEFDVFIVLFPTDPYIKDSNNELTEEQKEKRLYDYIVTNLKAKRIRVNVEYTKNYYELTLNEVHYPSDFAEAEKWTMDVEYGYKITEESQKYVTVQNDADGYIESFIIQIDENEINDDLSIKFDAYSRLDNYKIGEMYIFPLEEDQQQ